MRRYNEELLIKLYDYIMKYQRDNGASPSFRTIGGRFPYDFSSTSKVKNYVKVLVGRNLLELARDGSIEVDERFNTDTVTAPLVGRIACGDPSEEMASIEETYALPRKLFGSGELFTLNTYGESMTGYGINDGDYVVIRRQQNANDGQVVVALVDGKNTLKRLYHKGKKIILHPENDKMDDIVVRECDIQGVLVGKITLY